MVSVLVAYATKNGSTLQVAQAVTETLRHAGAQAATLPARSVRGTIAGYDLVVVGGPLYSGRWHRDARRFLRRHQAELAGSRVAVFGMGPRDDTVDAWRRSRAQLDSALAKLSGLHPVAVAIFGGVDPPRRDGRPRRDLRDWQTIAAWAAGTLTAAVPTGPKPSAFRR